MGDFQPAAASPSMDPTTAPTKMFCVDWNSCSTNQRLTDCCLANGSDHRFNILHHALQTKGFAARRHAGNRIVMRRTTNGPLLRRALGKCMLLRPRGNDASWACSCCCFPHPLRCTHRGGSSAYEEQGGSPNLSSADQVRELPIPSQSLPQSVVPLRTVGRRCSFPRSWEMPAWTY